MYIEQFPPGVISHFRIYDPDIFPIIDHQPSFMWIQCITALEDRHVRDIHLARIISSFTDAPYSHLHLEMSQDIITNFQNRGYGNSLCEKAITILQGAKRALSIHLHIETPSSITLTHMEEKFSLMSISPILQNVGDLLIPKDSTEGLSEKMMTYLSSDSLFAISSLTRQHAIGFQKHWPRMLIVNTAILKSYIHYACSTDQNSVMSSQFQATINKFPQRYHSKIKTLDISASPSYQNFFKTIFISFPNIENLSLSNCQLTDNGLQCLTSLKQLRQLDLSVYTDTKQKAYSPFTGKGLSHLRSLKSSLTHLNLANGTDFTDDGLTRLSHFTALRVLNLSNCRRITETGLGALLPLIHLEVLNLHQCRVRNGGVEQLQYFASFIHLRELRLSGANEIKGMKSILMALLSLRKIETLLLSCNSTLEDHLIADQDIIHNFRTLQNIRNLDIHECEPISRELRMRIFEALMAPRHEAI